MPGSSSGSEPTPPSPPSSAADPAAARGGTAFPLALAVASALSCWNLFGAPFAIVVAAGALALALRRARGRAGPGRTRLRVAAAVAGLSLAVGAFVLLTGLRGGESAAPVGAPAASSADAQRALDEAERRSAERREAARRELEKAEPPATAPPDRRGAR